MGVQILVISVQGWICRSPVWCWAIVLCSSIGSVRAEPAGDSRIAAGEQGTVVVKAVEHGRYVQYVPRDCSKGWRMAVLVHGMLGRDEDAVDVARRFIERWTSAADERNIILVAPAFDQENFGGRRGPGGGYRGLFGREIGADAFVNEIVDQYRALSSEYDGRFYLYGHSAGGQFVSRYVVRHPQRVIAAVISAAGTYAFPNPEVAWTNGMKPLVRSMRWPGSDETKHILITPDPKGWVQAATLPITVVVGAEDTELLPGIEGQDGRTRIQRARRWVRAMNRLASEHECRGRVRLSLVEGVGHNSADLTGKCIEALLGN
ncbi:MAG: alpha/beta hydrolase [Phycisphaerales bacterium]|nr:MAG: alpha/beta hydrolase [Phycisphaerales bacterium]